MASVIRGWTRISCIGLVALLPLVATGAQAQYDYGRGGGSDLDGESGVLLVIEGAVTNPRNTGYPDYQWDDQFSGRIGVGYQWANGNRLLGSIWGFSAEQTNVVNTAEAEITARTGDIAFGKVHEPAERFRLDWSVGLRVVSYEETVTEQGTVKSEMVGAKTALGASFRFASSFSVNSRVGFSFLDGEVTFASGLKDDGRSGTITDFDVTFAWQNHKDSIRVLLGWETSVWDGLAYAPDESRDSVTFSGPKLGLHFVF